MLPYAYDYLCLSRESFSAYRSLSSYHCILIVPRDCKSIIYGVVNRSFKKRNFPSLRLPSEFFKKKKDEPFSSMGSSSLSHNYQNRHVSAYNKQLSGKEHIFRTFFPYSLSMSKRVYFVSTVVEGTDQSLIDNTRTV